MLLTNFFCFLLTGENLNHKASLKSYFKNGRFHCPNQCSKHYKGINGLSQHLNNECGVIPKFVSSICMKSYQYKNRLKLHMASVPYYLTVDLDERTFL